MAEIVLSGTGREDPTSAKAEQLGAQPQTSLMEYNMLE